MLRIGQGCDLHQLSFGRPLVIGGFIVPDAKGAKGHSDADCLTHAIIDAILGAAGLGDIGHHFPDDDPRWANARSIEMLKIVGEKIRSLGFIINNVDSTVHLQTPKIASMKATIAQNIADALKIQPFQVNIKAKTGEGIGPIGKNEAIEAYAVCLLDEPSPDALVNPQIKAEKPKSFSISIPLDEPPAPPAQQQGPDETPKGPQNDPPKQIF